MPCGFESHLSHQIREGTKGTLSFLVFEADSKSPHQCAHWCKKYAVDTIKPVGESQKSKMHAEGMWIGFEIALHWKIIVPKQHSHFRECCYYFRNP